jgi:DNA polymerase I-like protein with 3'-5' exonuclease and polymerase domains
VSILTIDVETSTHNKGHVFDPRNFLVSYSLKWNEEKPVFHYYSDPDFITVLRESIARATLLVGFNIKFDLHWIRRVLGYTPNSAAIFDTSLAEFILTGQEAVMASLDKTLASYGLPLKKDKVKEYWELGISTEDIPYEVLEEYNNWDVETTYMLYLTQLQILNEKQHKLVLLEGEDMLTIIEAEANGQKWDREEAAKALATYKAKIYATKKELWEFVPEKARPFFNWNSGDDLSALLYGATRNYEAYTEQDAVYKSGPREGEAYVKRSWFEVPCTFPQRFKPLEGTLVAKCSKEGYKGSLYYQVDEPTLRQLKARDKASKHLLLLLNTVSKDGKVVEMLEELFRVSETYNWQDNLLHGQFNQNVVATGRLSSSKPNMQNKPPELDLYLITRY